MVCQKTLIGCLVLAAMALATPATAEPRILKGNNFFSVMKDNTLSGMTEAGAAFDIYFLPGGVVTYRDTAGEEDRGRWRIDPDGDVCVDWTRINAGRQECFQVTLDGDRLAWHGKSGGGTGTLRGTVTGGMLRPAESSN